MCEENEHLWQDKAVKRASKITSIVKSNLRGIYPVYFGIIPSGRYNLLLKAGGALFNCSRGTLKKEILTAPVIPVKIILQFFINSKSPQMYQIPK